MCKTSNVKLPCCVMLLQLHTANSHNHGTFKKGVILDKRRLSKEREQRRLSKEREQMEDPGLVIEAGAYLTSPLL
jgi:hypothetical protein